MDPVLSIRDLVTEFRTLDGTVRAVDRVSLSVLPGEVLGVVGESGCGKSVTMLSALRLIPQPPGFIRSGQVLFEGIDLLELPPHRLRRIRGKKIAMIFQDPMMSLNPLFTVGEQLTEAIRIHNRVSRKQAWDRAVESLKMVGIAEPGVRLREYPHEFSGGMRQRAMIAMAIVNQPQVLIADEPTTALDVTIQAQVLRVLQTARTVTGSAVVLITHNLGLIAECADRVAVMYAGRIVETGGVFDIFRRPLHPYTVGLMASLPRMDVDVEELTAIPGQPPHLLAPPTGCRFHPRCPLSEGRPICWEEEPLLTPVGGSSHSVACHCCASSLR